MFLLTSIVNTWFFPFHCIANWKYFQYNIATYEFLYCYFKVYQFVTIFHLFMRQFLILLPQDFLLFSKIHFVSLHIIMVTLAMIAYGIGVLPLIRELWVAHPRVTQPWYSDNAGAGGKFQHILEHFRDLQARGPARGYYP